MTNIQEIKQQCFDKKVEDKILLKITNESTRSQLIDALQEIDPCICSCTECGCTLEDGDDGVMTVWGTCCECIENGMEE